MDLTSIVVGAAGGFPAGVLTLRWLRRRHAIVIERTVPVPMQPHHVRLVSAPERAEAAEATAATPAVGDPAPPLWLDNPTAAHVCLGQAVAS